MAKQLRLLLCALFLCAFAGFAQASVGIKINGENAGNATNINFITQDSVTTDGSTVNVNIIGSSLYTAGIATGGGTSLTTLENAIPVGYAYVRKALSSTVGQAGTLANGTPGQLLVFEVTVVSGSGTFIVTPTTKTGYTSMTFNAAGDRVALLYVNSTLGWIVVSQESVTINP